MRHRVLAGESVRETSMTKKRFSRFRQGLRKAFSLQSPHGPLGDEDRQWIHKLAKSIVERGWAMVAVMTLSSVLPLGSLASQAMVFLRPFQEPMYLILKPLLKRLVDAELLSGEAEYERLLAILDRRDGIETMIQAIEDEEARNEPLARPK